MRYSDRDLYDAALRYCEGFDIVDVGEAYYNGGCDLSIPFAGDVAEYTLIRRR